jgi:hypothetical protein
MRFRKLRIAWSVFWGLAAVLLIVLWVRSYSRYDCVTRFDANRVRTSLDSGSAVICFAQFDYGKRSPVPILTYGWRWERSQPIAEADAKPTGPSFQWDHEPVGLGVSFPHWFPVLVFAALAMMPWVRWTKHYSLRTLLIATTLVAVVLGVVVYGASH